MSPTERTEDASTLSRTRTHHRPSRGLRNGRILAAAIIVCALLFSACFFLVVPGQAIVVTRMGDPTRVITEPGLAWKIPAAWRADSGRLAFEHDVERLARCRHAGRIAHSHSGVRCLAGAGGAGTYSSILARGTQPAGSSAPNNYAASSARRWKLR